MYFNNCDFIENKMISHENAKSYIYNLVQLTPTSAWTQRGNIGYNYFSTYFYLKAEESSLNIYDYGFDKLKIGELNLCHGGYNKISHYIEATNKDIIFDFTPYEDYTLTSKNFYTISRYVTTLDGWVGLTQKRVKTNLATATLIKSKLGILQNGLVIDWVIGSSIKKLLYQDNKLYDMMGNEVT
jgi:hypothetical protein